jgi:hypothetical protein
VFEGEIQSSTARNRLVKQIVIVAALAVAAFPEAALSQTAQPDVSTAPSAQNSGAGIRGLPGNKSGPAVKPGTGTVGSNSTLNQENPTVRQQDPSNIKGLPGNKSGPPARQPQGK